MKRVARSAIVEHPVDALYALIEDIESYPAFLPWCREAKIRLREHDRTVASIRVGMRGLQQSFSTENRSVANASIDMRLVEGPFKHFVAQWRLTPLGTGAARVEFSMEYEFSSRVLARVLDPLFGHIANTMVDAFLREADTRHGQAPH